MWLAKIKLEKRIRKKKEELLGFHFVVKEDPTVPILIYIYLYHKINYHLSQTSLHH